MTMTHSRSGFYGHVKQYQNLKTEIDQMILEVLESGTFVLGPHAGQARRCRSPTPRESFGQSPFSDFGIASRVRRTRFSNESWSCLLETVYGTGSFRPPLKLFIEPI